MDLGPTGNIWRQLGTLRLHVFRKHLAVCCLKPLVAAVLGRRTYQAAGTVACQDVGALPLVRLGRAGRRHLLPPEHYERHAWEKQPSCQPSAHFSVQKGPEARETSEDKDGRAVRQLRTNVILMFSTRLLASSLHVIVVEASPAFG